MAFSFLKKVVDDNNNKNIYRLLLTSLLQQQPNYYTLPTPIPTFPDYLLYFVEGSRNHPTARKLMLLLTMCFFLYLSWANW